MMMKTKKISAVGWWFGQHDTLSKHMEREQMMMMMKTTKSGKEEKEEKCRSGDEIVWTHSASAGVDHLLKHEAIQTHGSVMTNAKGAFSASLGEWAIFASMYFAKEVFNMQRAQREKVWKRFQVDMLKGKEMLVVGYGDIGRSIEKERSDGDGCERSEEQESDRRERSRGGIGDVYAARIGKGGGNGGLRGVGVAAHERNGKRSRRKGVWKDEIIRSFNQRR